jgi:multidrug efflux pump subunit AcrA (membrane-fusion protein)
VVSQVISSLVAIQEHKAVPLIARKARRKFPFLAGAVVLIALAAIGVAMRASKTQPIQQPSNKAAEMTVTVIHPQKASIIIPVLPGQTEAYTDAPIYAQTSGYLNKWYFDIGAKVKMGDVLAEIDTPEVDRMQQTSPLRVYVSVPQAFADLVKIGTEGDLTLDEFPGRRFLGHVTNTARAIDPTSRTLLTELRLSP